MKILNGKKILPLKKQMNKEIFRNERNVDLLGLKHVKFNLNRFMKFVNLIERINKQAMKPYMVPYIIL